MTSKNNTRATKVVKPANAGSTEQVGEALAQMGAAASVLSGGEPQHLEVTQTGLGVTQVEQVGDAALAVTDSVVADSAVSAGPDDAGLAVARQGRDLIARTGDWFAATGQMPALPTPDARQVAFYTGMQCEELAEKLSAILGEGSEVVTLLEFTGRLFKLPGKLDYAVRCAMVESPSVLLDGDLDLIWVSVGGARAMGSDVVGAYGEVGRANWAKGDANEVFQRHPTTGKVLKPADWAEPDLNAFIHNSLRRI